MLRHLVHIFLTTVARAAAPGLERGAQKAPGRTLGLLVLGLPALLLTLASARAVDLVINEFMAINPGAVQDEYGDYDDWVEIHNFGSTPINIEGMYITDNLLFPTKYELPDTIIPAGGYVIIWCDGESNEGALHTHFRLDGDGEEIGLFEDLFNGNDPVDTLSFGQQIPDVSYGRYPNGTGDFAFLGNYTPAADNAQPYNLPPYLTDTGHDPVDPTDTDTVFVTTDIVEDFGLAGARLFYDPGTGFVDLPLSDDGQNGDGAAGDGEYGARIPPLPLGTIVEYYVWAVDDSGASATDPPAAPAEVFSYEVGYEPPPLFINEFLASNSTTNPDEWGDYDDWVEIYNLGGQPINMGGYHLTDDLADPTKFVFPDTLIGAGGFLLVWCDGEPHEGPLHTGFRLGASGEQVGLFDNELHGYAAIDSITFGPQTTDVSYGRAGDGSPEWVFFPDPTPGASNGPSAARDGWGSPLTLRLMGNYPNPVRHGTRIVFRIPEPRRTVLRIVRADGRQVATLVDGRLEAGRHAVRWNATDGYGRSVSPGVYFYSLDAGPDRASGKMLVIE